MSITLPLLCFNDVYRVNQRYVPQPGSPDDPDSSNSSGQISVSQFAQLVYNERAQWADREAKGADGEVEKDGLVLFAGDVFNPSVESSVTRGSHMVPIMNALKVDVACVGESVIERHRSLYLGPRADSKGTTTLISVRLAWSCLSLDSKLTSGYPHLTRLLHAINHPWLLSNIVDRTTGEQPSIFKRFHVTERCGVRIGLIGLVEQ